MRYLIDTDWVADYLAGRQEAFRLFSGFRRDEISVSLMTSGEIYEGVYYSRDPRGSQRTLRNFLRWVSVAPISRSVMQGFARIRGDLRSRGQLIGDPDILIAATAIQHDAILVTRNIRHYGRIPELKLL